MINSILNVPYSLIGLLVAIFSLPVKINFSKKYSALIINVRSFWYARGYMKGTRAMTIGQVVLLGPNLENGDLEHELVHVDQYKRLPIIFPILYYVELFKRGYKENKYEVEAYSKAGNLYKGE